MLITGAGGPARHGARRGVPRRARADARRLGRHAAAAGRSSGRTSCCTPRPGPTSTAPRTTRRAPPRSTSAARRTSRRSARRSCYFSTDYVFDGAKREPYVESDAPNPLSAYGRTKLHGEAAAGEQAWIVRTSGLFGWTSHNFVRTMLRLGAERDEVSVVADQRTAPTYVGHLAAELPQVLELPFGVYHVAADGDCTWAEFARGDLRGGGPVAAACARSRARSGAHGRHGRRTRSCAARRPARRACRTGASACAPAWIGSKEALTEEISRRRQQVRQQASARMLRVRAGDQFAVAVGVGCAAKRSCAVVPVALPLVGGPLGTSARLRPLERLQPSGAWMSAMPESVSASPSSRMLIVARRSGYGRSAHSLARSASSDDRELSGLQRRCGPMPCPMLPASL